MTSRNENGLTLVELLLAVTLLGLITAAVGQALAMGLRTADETGQRLSESADAQLVSAFFVNDVQTADSVTTGDATCGGSASIVRLRWTDNVAVVRDAAYSVEVVGGEPRLLRHHCLNGTLLSTQTLARHLNPTNPVAVACTSGSGAAVACSGTAPVRIALAVTDTSGYRFDLTGARRALQ